MEIKSITLIYYSPTHTTQKILKAIATGFEGAEIIEYDLTLPKNRTSQTVEIKSDLIILGVPVYEEHIPELVLPFLKQFTGSNIPAVIAAVYGNVGYGMTLVELKALCIMQGFHPIAAGAFIGEHSWTHVKFPMAVARPDSPDLQQAVLFGEKINAILRSYSHIEDLPAVEVSGRLPFQSRIMPKDGSRLFSKAPRVDPARCTSCGVCAQVCPVGAIDPKTFEINNNICTRCFACVRCCKYQAREIQLRFKPIVYMAMGKLFDRRREPKIMVCPQNL